jgi:hypothetical protein
MSARRGKRIPVVISDAIPAGGFTDVRVPRGTCAFSAQVVDATTFAAIAWTLAYESDPGNVRHFSATALPYVEESTSLRSGLVIRFGAAVAARVELIAWRS